MYSYEGVIPAGFLLHPMHLRQCLPGSTSPTNTRTTPTPHPSHRRTMYLPASAELMSEARLQVPLLLEDLQATSDFRPLYQVLAGHDVNQVRPGSCVMVGWSGGWLFWQVARWRLQAAAQLACPDCTGRMGLIIRPACQCAHGPLDGFGHHSLVLRCPCRCWAPWLP